MLTKILARNSREIVKLIDLMILLFEQQFAYSRERDSFFLLFHEITRKVLNDSRVASANLHLIIRPRKIFLSSSCDSSRKYDSSRRDYTFLRGSSSI